MKRPTMKQLETALSALLWLYEQPGRTAEEQRAITKARHLLDVETEDTPIPEAP